MNGLPGRIGGIMLMVLLALIIAYASRFWPWGGFWSTEGAFGIAWLHPNGDWVRRSLRGTAFARFDLLIWGGLSFLLLSLVHALGSRFTKPESEARA
jgi:hypothetical protein